MQSAPTLAAKLVMLLQWRAGLRVSEALDVRPEDLRLGASPTLGVRQGKGGKARIVPIHPELQLFDGCRCQYRAIKQGSAEGY